MTTPTTHEVIHRLAELSRMLDAATLEVAQLDEAAVRAKAAYEVAFARAFITAQGSVDFRKQQSVLDTSDAKLTAELAERIRTIRDQIDVGRSLNSAVKAEWAASGTGKP